jgi:hypothetical protein
MAQSSTTSGKGFLIGAFALVAVLAIVGAYQVSKVLFPPGAAEGARQAGTDVDGPPSAPGWEIRYNAAASLARRGSPRAIEVLDVLREMLDEQQQMRNFRIERKDGTSAPHEEVALGAVLIALKAVAEWHQHAEVVRTIGSDNSELQKLYQAIDKLGQSHNRVVSTEARKVRLALKQR